MSIDLAQNSIHLAIPIRRQHKPIAEFIVFRFPRVNTNFFRLNKNSPRSLLTPRTALKTPKNFFCRDCLSSIAHTKHDSQRGGWWMIISVSLCIWARKKRETLNIDRCRHNNSIQLRVVWSFSSPSGARADGLAVRKWSAEKHSKAKCRKKKFFCRFA